MGACGLPLTALSHRVTDPFRLPVGTILSAQTASSPKHPVLQGHSGEDVAQVRDERERGGVLTYVTDPSLPPTLISTSAFLPEDTGASSSLALASYSRALCGCSGL